MDILDQATTEEVFQHMSLIGGWNFISYFILEAVCDEFILELNESKDFNSEFSRYKQNIQHFKENTLLIDFLSVWSGRCDDDRAIPGSRSVIVKCIANPASFTIADACTMGNMIAGKFNLRQIAFQLSSGRVGSVYIKWFIPVAASTHILEIMRSKKSPDLLGLGILELAVERKIFQVSISYSVAMVCGFESGWG